MKKNRAIWVALIVLAAAALLMFFVVLPQTRGDKTANQLARQAEETVEQPKITAQKTADQASADQKAGILAKMARVKGDGEAATVEFEALFANSKLPTVEQVDAARARLEATLKSASEIVVPEGVDAATAALISKTSEGAKKALATLGAMPRDVAGAKTTFDGMKAMMMATLTAKDAPKTVPEAASEDVAKAGDVKPADNAVAVKPADSSETKPADAADEGPVDPAQAILPAFDVLRVERDGSTVIAGRAAPGATIDIMDGDKVIASAVAGDSGDFVAVLDNPLAAGDHQLVLKATGKDGKTVVSVEVATVSVPSDKSGQLLAMVTKPGEASRIMTMPEGKETVVAQIKPADAAAKTEVKPVDLAKADNKAIATPELPADATDLANSAPIVRQEAAQDTAQASDTVKPANTVEIAGNDTTQAAKPVETAVTAPEVRVSAVEIEGDKIFVAGSARPKSVVRVYADDKLVAEVRTDENGRFVADSKMPLAIGDHTIRADVLSRNGQKVEFRASVPFFRPEGQQLAAVAGDTISPNKMQPLADGAYDNAREEAGKAIALLKQLYDAGRTPTIEELAAARSATEIALKTLSQIKIADNVDPTAKQMADKTAGEAAKALALLKSLPQDAGAVKTALNAIDDAVTSAVAPAINTAAATKATASEKEQADAKVSSDQSAANKPALVEDNDATESSSQSDVENQDSARADIAKADQPADDSTEIASADDQPKVIEQAPLKPSEASVIIRRGDTLWQISRRVYGRGVRYTTIYIANEDQINNPDKILPGQIFGVPVQPLPNSEELHRKRLKHEPI
ncbi:MAG: LysM peptidoglycan binding protein [Rhizobium sp.]|nr:LysM peptidoglycan binding protein [Rhizobium sp.]